MFKKLIPSIIIIVPFLSFGNIDTELQVLIKKKGLTPLEKIGKKDVHLFSLGEKLFNDKLLSGNKNISCMDCHHPHFGTSDGLPFSIGEGGFGIGRRRTQAQGNVVRRNSPGVFNLGYDDTLVYFWDGRVTFDPKTSVYQTPHEGLNGPNPRLKEIVEALNGPLAAQAIFPVLSVDEMLGKDNSLSELKEREKIWEGIMERLMENNYLDSFQKAYPGESKFNIGHMGSAVSHFISREFNFVDTPYDNYLRGDLNAMTLSEKKGLKVFLTKGKCIECHVGKHLTDFDFKSSGVPQISSNGERHLADPGRFGVTGKKRDRFLWRTPPLRNISLTEPFMHSGLFATLEQVVDHYNDVKSSLYNGGVPEFMTKFYAEELLRDNDPLRNKMRFNFISVGAVKRGLQLTDSEKKDLVQFLKTGLLDKRLKVLTPF